MSTEIILIGPPGAGKSTIGWLLSEKLGIPQIPLDSIKYDYFEEIGYDKAYAAEIYKTKGFHELHKYWRPFDVHSVQRILENRDAVIDFGAGASVYDEAEHFEKVRNALEPFPFVILLQPMPDKEKSIEILHSRNGYNEEPEGEFDFTSYFINHHCNNDLAKHIVYTDGKLPSETCEEIINRLGIGHLKVEDIITGTDVSLKRADYGTWSALHAKRYPLNYAEWDPNMPELSEEKEKEFWRDYVDSGMTALYGIYTQEGKLIGFINSFERRIPGRKSLQMFEIRYQGGMCETGIHIFEETERQKGHAMEAYRIFHSHLSEKFKIEKTTACTYSGNHAAQALYKKLGYTQVGSYIDNGHEYITFEYAYNKSL